MPKGYLIAHAHVTDPQKWAQYVAKASDVIKQYGGAPLVRGGRCETTEGNGCARNVILEFPTYEAAHAYATSTEYAEARQLRQGAGTIDITIVEGV